MAGSGSLTIFGNWQSGSVLVQAFMVSKHEHFIVMIVYVSSKLALEIHILFEELRFRMFELVRPASVAVMILMNSLSILRTP